MRTRVASIVTLLTLVLLGFLLIQSCSLLAKEENQNYRDTLYLACQAAGAALDENDAESRQAGLEAMELYDRNVVAGIYNADGSVLYASDGSKLITGISSYSIYIRRTKHQTVFNITTYFFGIIEGRTQL